MNSQSSWIQKGFRLIFIVFCMELGMFLVVFPWTDHWQVNLMPSMIPAAREFWLNGYFRGAVSGVGLLNLWIALLEVFRLAKPA